MYVWYPKSLGDYTDGVVCAIAESKVDAVDLAVEERYPFASRKRGMSASERAAIVRANLDIVADRIAFRDELMMDKPRVIRRGAIVEYGGG
jgi:hypothetical protein